MRLAAEKAAKDPDAPYGRKADGTPRQRPGVIPASEYLTKPTTVYSATENEKRVLEAVELMRSMQFVRGKTVRELAKKWGMTVHYATQLTTKAWKICCEEVTDKEMLGTTIGEAMLKMVTEGGKDGAKFETKKIAILAAKVLLDMSPGLRAPAEHHVVASRKDDLPDDPVELERIARKMLDRCAEEARPAAIALLGAGS